MALRPTRLRRPGRTSTGRIRTWVETLTKKTYVAILAVGLTIIALNHLGLIGGALDILGRGYIAKQNTAYLHEAGLQSGESILVLTALDTGLEVLKSSSAGISFIVDVKVQVGEIVSVVQKLTEKALAASLVGAASLTGLELVLGIANILAVPLLTLTVLALGVHYAARGHFRWLANISGQISEILVLFTLLVHLGLPLMVFGTSLVAKSITAPIAAQSHQQFIDTRANFHVDRDADIHKHVEAVINRYKETSDDTHTTGRTLAGSVVRHIVAIAFNAFLFPLMLLALATWVARIFIRHTLRIEELIAETKPAAGSSAPKP